MSPDAHCPDRFDKRACFLETAHGKVHRALFDLADRYGYVWLEGKGNHGIRVVCEPRKRRELGHERRPGTP